MSSLEYSLLATIAWFDLFDYPLTAWEAWKWRMSLDHGNISPSFDHDSYLEVLEALQGLKAQGKLECAWSFFHLPGRAHTVDARRTRYLLARQKFKRARRVARILRCIPWVRMISVCNSLGYSNAAKGSDIDFFIIASRGRVWTVRAIALLFLRLFHLRPLLTRFGARSDEKEDRIDLTFFIDEQTLDLSALALMEEKREKRKEQIGNTPASSLPPSAFSALPDPYLSYWIIQQTPLWDEFGMQQRFWQANAHLREGVPHAAPYATIGLRMLAGGRFIQGILRVALFLVPESWWRGLQLMIMPQRLKSGITGGGVVLNDHVLKFHDIDRRREYREKWLLRLSGL